MKEHKCEVCGREIFHKCNNNGMILCAKHNNQYKQYGRFLDNNPRTQKDYNEIRVEGDIAYVYLYNQKCEKIAEAIIDTEDIPKIKYTKWKLSNGYVNNSGSKNSKPKYIHREILGVDYPVGHINHNTLDNRKCNLRPITKSQNQMNSNYKGINQRKDGQYMAYIKLHQKMINLGVYIDKNEAYFARWYAELIIFKEYRYPKEKPIISEQREKQIIEYVNKKVQRL